VKSGAADTTSPVASAVHVNGPVGPFFQGLGAGGAHTVAIDYSIPFIYTGGVYTWGANAPALGRTYSTGYGLVGGIFPRRVAAGERHACAIHDVGAGQLYCWGENEAGQVGVEGGPFASAMVVTLPVGPWEISAGARHTCVVSTGQALCFGDNTQGQLGAGQAGALARELVPGSWAQIAAGGAHTCAIDTAGAVWCWGANDRGQLGRVQDGSSDPQPFVAACP
jgi:alpha-tubulin suppressor-like RCC1 family protein